MPPSGELNSPLQIQTDPLPTIGARSRQIPKGAVVAQSCLTAATKVIDTLPSPSGEDGPWPALSPAGVGRACAHRRSLTLQSFSDGAAPARRRVRGSPKSLPKKQDFTTLQCSVRLVTLRLFVHLRAAWLKSEPCATKKGLRTVINPTLRESFPNGVPAARLSQCVF